LTNLTKDSKSEEIYEILSTVLQKVHPESHYFILQLNMKLSKALIKWSTSVINTGDFKKAL